MKLMVDVAWAVFNGKISGETKISIGSSKLTFSKSHETSKFSESVITSTKDPQKHLSRQKYMLMLSYNLKCIFPLGETHLKALIMLKLRCISLKQLHLISVVDNSFFQNLNRVVFPHSHTFLLESTVGFSWPFLMEINMCIFQSRKLVCRDKENACMRLNLCNSAN